MKSMNIVEIYANSKVAPLVGAWIEIKKQSEVDKQIAVAPLVGAWIEIGT